jgi:GMP synthase (glutamine-hydrolysing)
VQHLSFEGLGVIKDVLLDLNYIIFFKKAGIDLITHDEIIEADLLILLGSPISVNDTTNYPWLNILANLVEKRLSSNRAILGICFGAQLIALIMGARVYDNKKEIGWGLLNLTSEGMKSCLYELKNKYVLHWHGQTFDMPADAELLASSESTKNQAFSIGQNILGLQFHCEISGKEIESWLIGHNYELISSRMNISKIRENSEVIGFETWHSSKKMFTKWIDNIK